MGHAGALLTPGFRRRGPEIDLDLSAAEARLLTLVLPVLAAAPGDDVGGGAPAGYPRFRAHPDDDEAEARFRELTAGLLAADREADRRRFAQSLELGTLGAEDAGAWLRVLTAARLALAARLGVAERGWDQATPGPGPALAQLFGCLQDELATLLLTGR